MLRKTRRGAFPMGTSDLARAGVFGSAPGTTVLALAIAAIVSGCTCTAATGSPGSHCSTSADCASGLCVDNRCVRRDAGTVDPDCVDPDGDGYGEMCDRGADCDEGDATQTGVEVCDERDNDCDGVVDNGVRSSCGDCDPSCMGGGAGIGTGSPFDPAMDPSDGVGLDPEGAIILDSRRIDTHFIWIANTGEGTVSKFDTRTYVEVARYVTGPDGMGNDPSRTSVNTLGDVYVGNRTGTSLTKISALGAECPDTNGDGLVTTSTGPTDVKPWGMDDCILWHTDLPDGGIIRAVAAQDEMGPDGELIPYVWVGGWESIAWKLDGTTGAILVRTASPTNNYGFALDGNGNLWISGRSTVGLGRIDTTRCRDTASCGDPVCGDDGDTCVKQRVSLPAGHNPYGITVDRNQRVWLASYDAASVLRYDPSAPAGSRWTAQSVGANCHGIAADGMGWVWAACWADGVARLFADDPSMWTMVSGTAGPTAKGMAVDMDGKIWAINQTTANATVITPGAGLMEATIETGIASTIVAPYTYSDMTGLQLRLATNPRGYYRRVFEGCPDDGASTGTEWGELRWEADVPPGTSLLWRVRTAPTRDSLATADWVLVAEVPPAASPGDIREALRAAGVTPQRFLEVEVQLSAMRESPTEAISPRVRAFVVTHTCPPAIE